MICRHGEFITPRTPGYGCPPQTVMHIKPPGYPVVLCDIGAKRERVTAPPFYSSGDGHADTNTCVKCLQRWRRGV